MITPALGSDLGHLAAPAPSSPWDDVRVTLLDALVAAKAAGRLQHAAWQEAFEAAADALRLRVLADAEVALRVAAAHARYPARRLASQLPGADAADALYQRLLAEGMPLERLERSPDDAASRRGRAAALEAAWDGASRVASDEALRWRARAEELAAWRRPMRGVLIVSLALLVVVVVVAAWLGGQLAGPEWFRPINDAWWRLPWP